MREINIHLEHSYQTGQRITIQDFLKEINLLKNNSITSLRKKIKRMKAEELWIPFQSKHSHWNQMWSQKRFFSWGCEATLPSILDRHFAGHNIWQRIKNFERGNFLKSWNDDSSFFFYLRAGLAAGNRFSFTSFTFLYHYLFPSFFSFPLSFFLSFFLWRGQGGRSHVLVLPLLNSRWNRKYPEPWNRKPYDG